MTTYKRRREVEDHNGKVFQDEYQMIYSYGIPKYLYDFRIKHNWELSDVLTVPVDTCCLNPKTQKPFNTIGKICEYYNIDKTALREAMKVHSTIEEAICDCMVDECDDIVETTEGTTSVIEVCETVEDNMEDVDVESIVEDNAEVIEVVETDVQTDIEEGDIVMIENKGTKLFVESIIDVAVKNVSDGSDVNVVIGEIKKHAEVLYWIEEQKDKLNKAFEKANISEEGKEAVLKTISELTGYKFD